jgi:hypothetical protein
MAVKLNAVEGLHSYNVFSLKEVFEENKMTSQQNRIFLFDLKNEIRKFGALETAVKLNAVEGLNHSNNVFCAERNY